MTEKGLLEGIGVKLQKLHEHRIDEATELIINHPELFGDTLVDYYKLIDSCWWAYSLKN